MTSFSEMAQMTDLQAAEYVALAAIGSEARDPQDLDTVINDVWLESVGNLHRFTSRLREGNDYATGLLNDVFEQRSADLEELLRRIGG